MHLLAQLPQTACEPSGALGLVASGTVEDYSSAMPGGALHPWAAAASETSKLAHDARNLLSALHLYSDLLASPGVLAPAFLHYAEELRMLGDRGLRLVDELAVARAGESPEAIPPIRRRPFPGIDDLAAELLALEAPLRALAGPEVRLEVECAPCAGLLGLNAEELLRILFNLVANSVEAMLTGPSAARRDGFLRITAQRGGAASFLARPSPDLPETVVLSVSDNGPGIATVNLERIFAAGFSTRAGDCGSEEQPDGKLDKESAERPPSSPRGLGLAIVQQLAEAAGGAVRAFSSPGLGARFDIVFPVLGALERWPDRGQRREREAVRPPGENIS
jgi:signal transduction histidine kinase